MFSIKINKRYAVIKKYREPVLDRMNCHVVDENKSSTDSKFIIEE